MKKKMMGLMVISTVFFVLCVTSLSFAQITSLHVVRASDSTLWSKSCTYGSCNAWVSISGLFTSQPTLTYDNAWGRYILTGRASDSSIWRSTFNAITGVHNNDWVTLGGVTPSPTASAGGATILGWAKMNADGSIDSCLNCVAVGTGKLNTGRYEVDFNFDNTDTPRLAVLDDQSTGTVTGQIGLANRSGDSSSIFVWTADSTGVDTDLPFTVVIFNW